MHKKAYKVRYELNGSQRIIGVSAANSTQAIDIVCKIWFPGAIARGVWKPSKEYLRSEKEKIHGSTQDTK